MTQFIAFIVHHWPLWVALSVVLVTILINECFIQKKRPRSLSAQQVIQKINHDDVILVDIRAAEDFKKGHIINSMHALPDNFKQGRMDKYKTKPLILVCNRGISAATLATQLRKQGFTNPMILEGGITAWRTAGLPLKNKK